jgi:hypothetical protein
MIVAPTLAEQLRHADLPLPIFPVRPTRSIRAPFEEDVRSPK